MWMLRFAQQANLTLSASQTCSPCRRRGTFRRKPKQGEVNPVWMLRCAMPYLITFRNALPSTPQGVAEEKFTP